MVMSSGGASLAQGLDINGRRDVTYSVPPVIEKVLLGQLTPATLTLPTYGKRWKVVIYVETGKNVFVAVNATAAVPSAATFSTGSSQLVPRYPWGINNLLPSTELSFITPEGSAYCTVAIYRTE